MDDDDRTASAVGPLDEILFESRQWFRRTAYRRRVQQSLAQPVEVATIRLLRAVQRHPGAEPTVGEVAAMLDVDPSTASRFADRAVEGGFVERRPCTTDQRRVRLRLTAAGSECLAAVTDARCQVLSQATESWSKSDIDTLASLLARLGRGLDSLAD